MKHILKRLMHIQLLLVIIHTRHTYKIFVGDGGGGAKSENHYKKYSVEVQK